MPLLNPGDAFPFLALARAAFAPLHFPTTSPANSASCYDRTSIRRTDLLQHRGTGLLYRVPIGHSADGKAVSRTGHVVLSVYSSGAIDRLVPDDVKGLIRYLREHAAVT